MGVEPTRRPRILVAGSRRVNTLVKFLMRRRGVACNVLRDGAGAEKGSSLEDNVEFNLAPDLTTALGTLAEKVRQFAADHSIGGEVSYRLNLVLDELVTNCLNYGLSEVGEPEIRVCLLFGAGIRRR